MSSWEGQRRSLISVISYHSAFNTNKSFCKTGFQLPVLSAFEWFSLCRGSLNKEILRLSPPPSLHRLDGFGPSHPEVLHEGSGLLEAAAGQGLISNPNPDPCGQSAVAPPGARAAPLQDKSLLGQTNVGTSEKRKRTGRKSGKLRNLLNFIKNPLKHELQLLTGADLSEERFWTLQLGYNLLLLPQLRNPPEPAAQSGPVSLSLQNPEWWKQDVPLDNKPVQTGPVWTSFPAEPSVSVSLLSSPIHHLFSTCPHLSSTCPPPVHLSSTCPHLSTCSPPVLYLSSVHQALRPELKAVQLTAPSVDL